LGGATGASTAGRSAAGTSKAAARDNANSVASGPVGVEAAAAAAATATAAVRAGGGMYNSRVVRRARAAARAAARSGEPNKLRGSLSGLGLRNEKGERSRERERGLKLDMLEPAGARG